MKSTVTVTDLTQMQRQRVCVAGYATDGRCLRLGFPEGRIEESWLRLSAREVIRPFSLVEVDLLWPTPEAPHTEDWVIDPEYKLLRGLMPTGEREALLNRLDDGVVESIFGSAVHQGPGWYVLAGEGIRSLGTVSPSLLREVIHAQDQSSGRWDYRLAFDDQAGRTYRLQVTDLSFRRYIDCLRDRQKMPPARIEQHLAASLQKCRLHLRIGLARGWEKYPDRCYIQITGVYSFPDYLEGRCFADF